jgi:exodeoxyribonuclease V alpha subunit
MTDDGETITGDLEHVIYESPESGFFVGRITREVSKDNGDSAPKKVTPQKDRSKPTPWNIEDFRIDRSVNIFDEVARTVTVAGSMKGARLFQRYTFTGRWTTHPRFGRQFKFDEYSTELPVSLDAIKWYLVEHCRGIGPVTASAIVEAFGLDSLKVLKEEPLTVVDVVERLSIDVAGAATEALLKIEAQEAGALALRDLFEGTRVSKRVIVQVHADYGQNAAGAVQENPFLLLKYWGVGFPTADFVRAKVNYPADGPRRVQAGLVYVLEQAASDGHTCQTALEFTEATMKLLEVQEQVILRERAELEEGGVIVEDEASCWYLRGLYEAETNAAKKLRELAEGSPAGINVSLEGLEEDQQEAALEATRSPVFLLTGGPGTGKTFCLRRLIDAAEQAGGGVAVAAPTGKAARRISELTGHYASTIHRLLDPRFEGGKFTFGRTAESPLAERTIVLDEVSMLDVRLLWSLLQAVQPDSRLIFVGDTDQLPSVGPGSVLRDIIASGRFGCHELTQIKRQRADSLIVRNCHRIKTGQSPQVDNESTDFFFLQESNEERLAELVVDLYCNRLPARYGVEPLSEIQVITAHRERTQLSAKKLNERIRDQTNPSKDARRFRPGDKVIQLKNVQADTVGGGSAFVANGDMGVVVENSPRVRVRFGNPERIVEWAPSDTEMDLAYAITCHKGQGDEWPYVIVPIHHSSSKMLLQRNWLYTAISRARDVCVLCGDKRLLAGIVARNKVRFRRSRLLDRLCSI